MNKLDLTNFAVTLGILCPHIQTNVAIIFETNDIENINAEMFKKDEKLLVLPTLNRAKKNVKLAAKHPE